MPERIGRYALQRQLGKGGFGRVYLGWDELLERQVAIKLPRHRYASVAHRREQFLKEARMAARLRDPGIVVVHDFGVDEQNRCYLVYEFVAGQSLRSRLASDEPPSVRESVDLIVALAEALNTAHKAGLVHRDLKPTNILLDETGRTRITDFGLAIDEESQWSMRGEVSGTLPYMAPEQLRGETHQLDGRTDIWALGVIFYELLTGRRPFQGQEAAELMDQILNREPRPPRQINDRVPRQIEQVCLRCLAKDVTNRYSAAIGLVEELREYLRDESASAGTPSEPAVSDADHAGGPSADDTPGAVARPGSGTQPKVTTVGPAKTSPGTPTRWFAVALVLLTCVAIAAWGMQYLNGTGRMGPPDVDTENKGSGPPVPPFPKPVLQRVRIVTEPASARIAVYGFDPKYGLVDPDQAVHPEGRTPVEIELWSGDYFVVAVLDDGRFHEVCRHVPRDIQAMPTNPYNHTRWYVWDDGSVVLPEIKIPAASVTDEMALFDGSDDFAVGREWVDGTITADDVPSLAGSEVRPKSVSTVPAHRRRVPPFYLDCRELTLGDYKRVLRDPPPFMRQWRGEPLTDDHPVVMLFIDRAIHFAELVGRRLPSEVEYEFAATSGGTRAFPWGDDVGRITQWEFGPAGEPAFDCVDTDRPVYGLFSNVAEWTSSWFSPYPPRLDRLPRFPGRRPGEYAVRGGPFSVMQREGSEGDWTLGPRIRIGAGDRRYFPGVGFRCARSAKPHLQPEDFEKILSP